MLPGLPCFLLLFCFRVLCWMQTEEQKRGRPMADMGCVFWKPMEWAVLITVFIYYVCRELCIVGKMAQDVGMVWICCGVVPILFSWFLRVPSLHALVFIGKLFCDSFMRAVALGAGEGSLMRWPQCLVGVRHLLDSQTGKRPHICTCTQRPLLYTDMLLSSMVPGFRALALPPTT